MQAYELMSLLSEAEAGQDMRVLISLSLQELMSGEKMDGDTYCLSLNISEVDTEWGIISVKI